MSESAQSLIAELFERQVGLRPDEIAVVCGDRRLTYAEVDRLAELMAARLRERGVGEECIIGLALERSELCAVAWLSVAKANAVCLWLDPDYPVERVSAMVRDAGPALIVTSRATDERIAPIAPEMPRWVLDGDDHHTPHDEDPPARPRRRAPLESASYVIYTSGSTGRPKGTVLTSTGVESLVETAVRRFGVTPDSRILQFSSLSFDVGFLEMCMALLVGGRLVVVPTEERTADARFLELLRREGVTHAGLPPAFLELLPEDGPVPDPFTIMTGADKVPVSVARRWSEKARILVCYGVTEATVNSTVWPYDPGWDAAVAPIGIEDPGTEALLLDASLRPVEPGQSGELYLAGDGLARGYLDRPDLTAQRFVANPFGAPGSRMYRTGDRAVRHPDGVLEFLGRVDDQLKIRGHRIEPTEVEGAVLSHPSVAQAVVAAQELGPGDVQLAAFVVAAEGQDIDPQALRRHIAGLLPAYMVPSVLTRVPALAVLPNGKIDRRSLPSANLAEGAAPPAASAGAPADGAEETLRALLSEAVGREVADAFDFVAMGGQSLAAMRLVSTLRARLGCEMTISDLFAARSVRELVRHLPVGGSVVPVLRAGERGPGPLPLSFEQERLWVLEAL
ncbi:non-ribosomal peptide synthetase, partial [Streptomyces coerulescens]